MGDFKFFNIRSIFGAEPISYDTISDLGSKSADLIVYAIPVMAFFTIWEMVHSWKTDKKRYNATEAFGSVIVGLGNVGVNLLAKTALILGAVFVYNLIPWRMTLNWWTIIPCILVYDVCSYWAHRVSHGNRFFWATHVVHHSAEHYNLTVSFRLSWVQHFKIIFLIPIVLFGFHPVIFFIVNQIMVLFQFWQHTEYIKRLPGFIEWSIITPSNHRVHHGSDEKYIDKNFGVLFTFWDRMFGTYAREEASPTYGITSKIKLSSNPFYLNFHEFADIIKDVRQAGNFRRKLFFLFASPADVATFKQQQTIEKKIQKRLTSWRSSSFNNQ
ncbi:MAG: sterol desaturase family protein [Chitinophagaceae bacterium]